MTAEEARLQALERKIERLQRVVRDYLRALARAQQAQAAIEGK